jgi:hypothetical protein
MRKFGCLTVLSENDREDLAEIPLSTRRLDLNWFLRTAPYSLISGSTVHSCPSVQTSHMLDSEEFYKIALTDTRFRAAWDSAVWAYVKLTNEARGRRAVLTLTGRMRALRHQYEFDRRTRELLKILGTVTGRAHSSADLEQIRIMIVNKVGQR